MKSKWTGWVGWAGVAVLVAMPFCSGYSQDPGTAPAPTPVTLSPAAADIVKLAESGTSDDVMLAYVQKSASPYALSADDVVYLKDVGLSSAVITAMLNHDKGLPAQPYTYDQKLYPATSQPPAPEPVAPEQPQPPPPTEAAPAPAYVGNAPAEVNYFYNDLSPYGSWVDLEGYGWCWQPSTVIINRSWRPYCDGGHWVNSDAGWFWQSEYSWGWAPFHYGRWHLHPRNGWVWFPDTVWAPAWVTWRSSGDYCGWAPLPYRSTFDAGIGFRFNGVRVGANFDFGLGADFFTFVALGHFNDRNIGHYRLPPTEVTRVYKQTTIINNYTVNNNHVLVNHGIPVERVSAATHTQIKTVAIHDLPAAPSRPVTRGGAGGGVYRRELPRTPVRPASQVVAQKVDNQHPVIQHTQVASTRVERRTPVNNVTPPATRNPGIEQRGLQTSPQIHQPVSPQVQPRTQLHEEPQQPSGGEKFTPRGTPQQNTPTTHPPVQVAPPITHAEEAKQSNLHYSSSHTTAPKQTAPLQTINTEQNPHVYYPKSYHQAASAHALPPEHPVTTAPPAHAPTYSAPATGNLRGGGTSSPGPSGGASQNQSRPGGGGGGGNQQPK